METLRLRFRIEKTLTFRPFLGFTHIPGRVLLTFKNVVTITFLGGRGILERT